MWAWLKKHSITRNIQLNKFKLTIWRLLWLKIVSLPVYLCDTGISHLEIVPYYYTMLRAVHISAAIHCYICQFFPARYQRSKSFTFSTRSVPVLVPIRLHKPAYSSWIWKAESVPPINIINCAVSVMLLSSITSTQQSDDCACNLTCSNKIVSFSCTCLLFVQVEILQSWKLLFLPGHVSWAAPNKQCFTNSQSFILFLLIVFCLKL